ncbi:hypothetical protein AB0N14_29445 [Streptomyces sp. NPDC051104]|uniref:hypothetical protein n=1 Tax=Streptomyces sp. NPDC051104 TaxID=3155044 RepID=UPI003420A909
MVDRDTFVTAGHCTTDWPSGVRFYVSRDQDVQSALDTAAVAHPGDPSAVASAVGVEGTAHTDSAYPGPSADPHDIAVIQLPAAAVAARWTFAPATLPAAGDLDALGPRQLNANARPPPGRGPDGWRAR